MATVAVLVNGAGAEHVLPPLYETTVGRMSTADYCIESGGCSRHQCSLTFVPPDHVLCLQKGSNSTKLVRAGQPLSAAESLSSKPGGKTVERLYNGDRLIIPIDVTLLVRISSAAPLNPDQIDTLPSRELAEGPLASDDGDASDAGADADDHSARSSASASDVEYADADADGGDGRLVQDGLLCLSDESDDVDGDAEVPVAKEEVDEGRHPGAKPATARPQRQQKRRRGAVFAWGSDSGDSEDSEDDAAEGSRARTVRVKREEEVKRMRKMIAGRRGSSDAGEVSDASEGASEGGSVQSTEEMLQLQQQQLLPTLTAVALRRFLQANSVKVKASARKAELIMAVNLLLSGSAQ